MLARIFLVSLLGLTGVSAAEVTKLRAWQESVLKSLTGADYTN